MNEDLIQKVRDTTIHYANVAVRHYGLPGFNIHIHFNVRGVVAGRAYLRDNTVGFNKVLLMENVDAFLKRTVPHEVAHLVAYNVYDHAGHGRPWKEAMEVFGCETSRCHRYDVTNAKVRNVERFPYGCGCEGKVFNLTSIRVKRIKAGHKYFCRRCRHYLHPLEAA